MGDKGKLVVIALWKAPNSFELSAAEHALVLSYVCKCTF